MKIPILYNPLKRKWKYFRTNKRYKYHKEIISLGCDCHPAYVLQSFNIRKQSLPFDWLNTDPVKGLSYVIDNIEDGFEHFLSNLSRNKNGHVVSARYPYAEFMHEKELIENADDREKFIRRINRFLDLIHKDAVFLYNITSESLIDSNKVQEFYDSLVRFESLMKPGQTLYIYVRHNESLDENRSFCDKLLEMLKGHSRIVTAKYITHKQKYGLWGNEKAYPDLFESLGINIKLTFPVVKLK